MPTANRHHPEAKSLAAADGGGTPREPTNLNLSVGSAAEALKLAVDISQVAGLGTTADGTRRRQERWLVENQGALNSSNAYVERHGVLFAQYRNF